jgi:hypothetical protein
LQAMTTEMECLGGGGGVGWWSWWEAYEVEVVALEE